MKLYHILCFALLFLSGCRYTKWTNDVFHQSQTQFCYDALQNDYLRSLRIYDQFTTLGLFDVLWLSDDVRTLYSKEYASLHGFSEECYMAFLRRQLCENEYEIAFYVLGVIPHAHDALLTDDITPWTLYLYVDGNTYTPKSLKTVELPPVYKTFFGKRYTSFKTAYYVTFCAKTLEGYPVITDATSSISLCFHMAGREDECLLWQIASPGGAVPQCITNPDILAYDI